MEHVMAMHSNSSGQSARRRLPHLVVVDDEPSIREICVDVLRSEGYEVSTADNGREAVDLLARQRADLVLMDIMMPVLDGVTACKLIKENEQTRDIPVVIMSASTNLHSRISELHCVASAVVPKPFDFDQLLDTVRRFVA
jgi:CheY-like chemotaxis protein